MLNDEIDDLNPKVEIRLNKQEEITGNLTQTKMVGAGFIIFIGWVISNLDFIKKILI